MQIKKILFPTNFEHLSLKIVEELFVLKEAGLEEIVFLFVIDRDEVSFNLLRGFDKEYADELSESARLRFLEWEERVQEAGLKASHVIEIGSPEGKILEVSCRENVDLIVAGRRRPMATDAIYLSGTTMGVLRRTAIPVMIYKSSLHNERMESFKPPSFERVVLPTDFSDPARCAYELVKGMKGVVKQVNIMNVLSERDFRKFTKQEIAMEESEAMTKMHDMVGELSTLGVVAKANIFAGNTVTETLGCQADNDAGCIVMGTTGKHGIVEAWLGSASHRVAEQSPVTVILVPMNRDVCYM
ncbi:MAG: hypothetical protein C0608_05890 [Deltaproteobacteria bacterium]|nr:MAG: hypothetical protein C0608_05890 [Deltaproteobacteria bacterium]